MGRQTVILAEAGAGGSKLGRAAWGLRRAEAGAKTDECVTESRRELSDGHAFLQGKEGCSMPGILVLHYLPEFAQTDVR